MQRIDRGEEIMISTKDHWNPVIASTLMRCDDEGMWVEHLGSVWSYKSA